MGMLCTLTIPNTWRTPSAFSASTAACPPVMVFTWSLPRVLCGATIASGVARRNNRPPG
jgi:hypothetical protein